MLAAAPDDAEPQNLEPHKCKGWSWVSWTELRAVPSERMFVPLINLLGDLSHASLTTDAAGTEDASVEPPTLPPTLTPAERAAGVLLADERWGYKYVQEAGGFIQPFDFILPAVDELRAQLQPKAHDVYIATYPKCGTTWMQQLVLLLLRGSGAR